MRNIALKLRYDGSAYHGWQIQKEDRSVCETVQDSLKEVFGGDIKLTGCGRTDAGVHALSYCANFKTEATIPCERIPLAVNSRLPGDIAVLDARDVEDDFNAVLSCKKKEYVYKILNCELRDPFLKDRVCFYPQKLDVEMMKRAAASFTGTHDFKAVRSLGTETKTTVRTVYWCEVEKKDNLIEIAICANGFLYNMCRAMVGTMVYASYGKIDPDEIPALLEKGDRRLTGPTMPPQGLYMNRLWYEGKAGEMFEEL